MTVVVVGAGFAGLKVVRGLKGTAAKIILLDKRNHHLFQPLLYQVATASLNPSDIAFPIRSIFRDQKNVEVRMAEVAGVDASKKQVMTREGAIGFDYLVLATGSQYNYFGHDEWEKVAPKLKSIPDAIQIREKVLTAFEMAEMEPDEKIRKELMTFVFVGAGPTGVELAGALAELSRRALARDFRHIDPKLAHIIILEAAPNILTSFPAELAEKAKQRLEELGVECRVGARVEKIDEGGVIVSGERIAARNVFWTAGVKTPLVAEWLGVVADRQGRVVVQKDLSVPGHPDIFVIGDAACFQIGEGKTLPGVAPVAMQQGVFVGKLLRRRISGESPVSMFEFHDKGNLATIGRGMAIADFGSVKLSGLLAWILWLTVHIFYLIGFRNRVLVIWEWVWAYFTFQRGARLITSTRPPK